VTSPGDVGRRSVLRLGAASATLGGGLAGLTAAGLTLARPARAVTVAGALTGPAVPAMADALVVVTLSGGLDGLSMIPPIGDDHYPRARPTLAVPGSVAHRVSDTFGLHPALAPLLPLWEAGRLAAVQAVGQAAATRSHEDAVAALDHAAPVSTAGVPTGWVDRVAGVAPGAGTYTVMQVGNPLLPGSMAGPHENVALSTLDAASIAVSETIVPVRGWQDALAAFGAGPAGDLLVPALTAAAQLGALGPAASAAESGYPATPLGQGLRDVARLVKANLGVRVVSLEDTGWDLHAGLGTPQAGPMAAKLGGLARALLAFATDLGPDLERVVLVTVSEFGRRVAENGSGGADHGRGSAMLVLGGAVKGGKVYGRWPGLDDGALDDGALAVTTDYRSVLGEILAKRCGVSETKTVFPAFTPAPLGLVDGR
jgi:uncharacterized protein (DUF1501 family)